MSTQENRGRGRRGDAPHRQEDEPASTYRPRTLRPHRSDEQRAARSLDENDFAGLDGLEGKPAEYTPREESRADREEFRRDDYQEERSSRRESREERGGFRGDDRREGRGPRREGREERGGFRREGREEWGGFRRDDRREGRGPRREGREEWGGFRGDDRREGRGDRSREMEGAYRPRTLRFERTSERRDDSRNWDRGGSTQHDTRGFAEKRERTDRFGDGRYDRPLRRRKGADFEEERTRRGGDFTERARRRDVIPQERPKMPQTIDLNEPIRLNRFIAHSGMCSRREADEMIARGDIQVNGEVVTEMGHKVVPAQVEVTCKGKKLDPERKVYILLNKPKDCFSTTDDPHAGRTVLDAVEGACTERIYPVGRLDRNSTGLLLLTNDGALTEQLTHPSYEKRKVYEVAVDRDVTREEMQRLLDGIELEEGIVRADAVGYAKADRRDVLGIEIHSGQNRVVRRMLDALGLRVNSLDRVYYAGLTKRDLPRGQWRYLTPQEVANLKSGQYE